jgi:hypothetical protein
MKSPVMGTKALRPMSYEMTVALVCRWGGWRRETLFLEQLRLTEHRRRSPPPDLPSPPPLAWHPHLAMLHEDATTPREIEATPPKNSNRLTPKSREARMPNPRQTSTGGRVESTLPTDEDVGEDVVAQSPGEESGPSIRWCFMLTIWVLGGGLIDEPT